MMATKILLFYLVKGDFRSLPGIISQLNEKYYAH